MYFRYPLFSVKMFKMQLVGSQPHSLNTDRKSNVYKTLQKHPGRILQVLCTLNLHPVSRGYSIKLKIKATNVLTQSRISINKNVTKAITLFVLHYTVYHTQGYGKLYTHLTFREKLLTQLAFTCLKSTTQTLEQGVKFVQS